MRAIVVGAFGVQIAEADFVQRLAARDRETEQQFAAHFGQLLRVVLRRRSPGRPPHFVEDVVQETFARVLAAVQSGRVREPDSFGSFVLGVGVKVLQEASHGEGRFKLVGESSLDRPGPDDPEADVGNREILAAAAEALEGLAPRDRELLQEVALDADKDELCQRFGVTRPHLRVLLHRAKERLQVLMAHRRG
jgi:RNA polymerase sigma factor (sigma-70 family)